MPTNRTAQGKWKNKRRAMITTAKRTGQLQCAICGRPLDPDAPRCTPNAIELDHIVPVARGGTDDDENLALLCFPCNRAKSDGTTPATTKHKRTKWCRVHRNKATESCPHSGSIIGPDDSIAWLAERWRFVPSDYTGEGPQFLRDAEARGLTERTEAATKYAAAHPVRG